MSYETYTKAVYWARFKPYHIRLIFWISLYYYNKLKYKKFDARLEDYVNSASNRESKACEIEELIPKPTDTASHRTWKYLKFKQLFVH